MRRPSELWLSLLIVAFATAAAAAGLFAPELYRDAASVLPQAMGQDAVTLFVVVPLLAIATAFMWRGSPGGRLLWLGSLGYMAYAYGTYALWARWNPLFLVYVALFGLSLYAVALGLVRTDAARVAEAVRGRIPTRSLAGFLAATAVLVSALWLSEQVTALVSGAVPPSIVQLEAGTNVVHVFDLGIVMPAFVIAAVLLLRGRPWGPVLAAMLLVKAATIGLAVVAMIWFMARRGYAAAPGYVAFFVALTTLAAALAWRLLAVLATSSGGARTATRAEQTV